MPLHIVRNDIAKSIHRIGKMELLFDLVTDKLHGRPDELQSPPVKEAVQMLSAYYESGDWLHDYELDEQQFLPSNLKRGVLSQDALYDLLSEIKNLTVQ